ncbi:MAG: hypothetical protein KGK11_07290 [Sphingomonadales bacterium]|nr:hypothetical protein [Sphingomonadales bacterium]
MMMQDRRRHGPWLLAMGLAALTPAMAAQAQDNAGASAAAAPQPTPLLPQATPMTDMLTRMEALEAQVARLTAQNEELANRQHQLEARLTALTPPPAPVPPAPAPAAAPAPSSATATNLAAMTGHPAPGDEGPLRPSAARIAAVKAVVKPQTADAAGDEYSYGYRLYAAKFYPEAEQQLKLYIDRYPHDSRIGFGRNLIGRAYLDEGKPREAAPWFLMNYKAEPQGPRAPDSLLGLAESMRQLGDTGKACIALDEFAGKFASEAKGRLRTDYDRTRGGLTCP